MTVAALRALLADIDREGGPDAARADQLDLPEPVNEATTIRAWATAHGVDCPRTGFPPRRVVEAWQAARSRSTTPPA